MDKGFVENILEPSFVLSRSGEVVWFNKKAIEVFEIYDEKVKNKNFFEWLDKKYKLDLNLENIFNLIESKNIQKIEIDFSNTIGKYMELNMLPLKTSENNILEVLVIFYDLTEYKKNEKDSKEKLELFKAAINSSIEGIIIFDNKGEVLLNNKSFLEVFEIKDENFKFENRHSAFEFLGKNIEKYQIFYKTLLMVEEDATSEYFELLSLKNNKFVEFYSRPVNLNYKLIGRMWSFYDITKQKNIEKKLEQYAHFDGLTGLPNRVLFFDRLKQTLGNARRYDFKFALLFIDLDRFKIINDSLGHNIGDEFLKKISELLRGCLREADTIARVGGDEFTVILSKINKKEDAGLVAEKILKVLEKPIIIEEYECFVGASIGISIYPDDGKTVEELMKNSDIAMYNAKEHGKNNYRFYVPVAENNSLINKLKLENELRSAIKNNEFLVYYQPQIDIKNGKIVGMEALVRWKHPKLGIISPGVFIPIAEETGLIMQIGDIVLETACNDVKKIINDGFHDMRVAVNLSGIQFKEKNIIKRINSIIEKTDLDPKHLELELTESIAMENVDNTIYKLNEINLMHIFLSIDDFGTGYSSLNYLKKYPIDKLKIDQSFVRDIVTDNDDAVIVETIIAMAHSLKIKVIAEGVETGEQLEFLKRLGCDEVQGYLFGKPVPLDMFMDMIKDSSYNEVLKLFSGEKISII